mmetsp:Transcript_22359/g.72099  ORF Transcript_22359/g.72099 Transcript_22359/m.72099 type:complete len:254 (-) Transcript_22359:726-1487(-)
MHEGKTNATKRQEEEEAPPSVGGRTGRRSRSSLEEVRKGAEGDGEKGDDEDIAGAEAGEGALLCFFHDDALSWCRMVVVEGVGRELGDVDAGEEGAGLSLRILGRGSFLRRREEGVELGEEGRVVSEGGDGFLYEVVDGVGEGRGVEGLAVLVLELLDLRRGADGVVEVVEEEAVVGVAVPEEAALDGSLEDLATGEVAEVPRVHVGGEEVVLFALSELPESLDVGIRRRTVLAERLGPGLVFVFVAESSSSS